MNQRVGAHVWYVEGLGLILSTAWLPYPYHCQELTSIWVSCKVSVALEKKTNGISLKKVSFLCLSENTLDLQCLGGNMFKLVQKACIEPLLGDLKDKSDESQETQIYNPAPLFLMPASSLLWSPNEQDAVIPVWLGTIKSFQNQYFCAFCSTIFVYCQVVISVMLSP